MEKLVLTHLQKIYTQNKKTVIHDFNLSVRDGEFIVFVGPSGCGKSTLLRMIAGLEDITSGELFLNGKKANRLPAKDRNLSVVFQNYALFPHLSVFENIAFGLRIRHYPKQKVNEAVYNAAEMLGLQRLLHEKPKQLSGGQRQRVALGRAIVRQADLFLMDEPLSNLDAKLRTQMREEILNLHQKLETTTIYVTHDQVEAMTMATRIVVLKDGRIQQIGTPKQIYTAPANTFVATFIGMPQMNVFHAAGSDSARWDDFIPLSLKKSDSYTQGRVLLGIRPENILVAADGLPVTVNYAELMGADTYVHGEIAGTDKQIVIRCEPDRDFCSGETVYVRFPEDKCHFFDAESGKRLTIEAAAYEA
ncbi:ABC transporter ATP-binding protein [Sporolactobacillus shoreicorticis]|uniref:ABC transporter ATP-binding protein n=1 Tax=Sporolactobacillus shoreicorticis TaxID=1923877 RepID=A0ABW5RYJ6_9BACL|nr:ABC transporter ATP-binding protein [Sporolactobacillus shoreicorticis]MCO7124804.1 ABC transporter ATP-binding protein [Sporolactobacillus shoreicorticis]